MRDSSRVTFFCHLAFGVAVAALLSIWPAVAQTPEKEDDVKNPVAGKPEAVSAGRKLFLESCSGCHGAEAEGGRGPNLARGDRVRGVTNRQLFSTMRDGVKGGDMPPSHLPEEQVWQILAYLRDLTATAFESSMPGDIRAGGELFSGKAGCSSCHSVRGRGGFLGPDLSNIGRTRSLLQLRESLLDPDAQITEGYRGVTVTTNSGTKIAGVTRDNTNYALDILDAQGNLHLLLKQNLREVVFQKSSLMPHDYAKRLSGTETQNVLAFLGRQSMRDVAPSVISPTAPTAVTQADSDLVRQSPGQDWLTYAGDYAGHRHSPLSEVTRDNVSSLVPKWVYHVEKASHLEVTPLVYEGVMYVSNSNEVDALDARTGRQIWMWRDEQSKLAEVNRGMAILGDRLFFVTSDAQLVAINRKTGGTLWQRAYADTKRGQSATMAPLAVEDKVIAGVAGGDSGTRGFVAAFSASTGDELWRFWTVPAKGEPGAESWGSLGPEWGGAATWLSGTYDPDLKLLYWCTGNPWPDFYGGKRQGDNLYSDSLIALDVRTGKLKWYFQFTPHDTHDWDAQAWPVLVDLPWQGRPRKLVLHANRNGYFYVLDRTNGQFLRATPYVQSLNWTKGIDAQGRPSPAPERDPTPSGNRTCPSVRGASNWMSPSYSPRTGLLYVPTLEQCDTYTSSAKEPEPMKNFAGTGAESIPKEPGKFFLRALDPRTGGKRWEYPMTGPGTMWAGVVSTAGGVVFFGDDDGQIVALDEQTGRHLWHFYMGQLLTASPITYRVDGKQYVSIASATDIFTFGLFEPSISVPLVPEREAP